MSWHVLFSTTLNFPSHHLPADLQLHCLSHPSRVPVNLNKMMSALANLPDRGAFGVVDGLRALQSHSPIYVCCHDNPGNSITVANGRQQLHDLYKKASHRTSATATAATKRQARQQLDDRSSKRHQAGAEAAATAATGGLEAALAAIAGSSKQPSSTPAAAAAAGTKAALQQQQQPVTAVAPAGAAPTRAVQPVARCSSPSHHEAAEAAGATPLGPSQQLNSRSSSRQAIFSAEQLKAKTNKELVDLLKARSCPVSGSKTELIRRLLDYQRRVKKAAQGTAV